MTLLLRKLLGCLSYAAPGGVSRAAKGADCKSAASWLRRFESYLPHQPSLAWRAYGVASHLRFGGETREGCRAVAQKAKAGRVNLAPGRSRDVFSETSSNCPSRREPGRVPWENCLQRS